MCDPEGSRSDIFATYIAPARGGDIYAICVRRSPSVDIFDALDPARLRIIDSAGAVQVDVTVQDYAAAGPVTDGIGQNPGVALLLEDLSGSRRRAHGMRLNYLNIVAIPLLLPHDRPTGGWQVEYSNTTQDLGVTIRIDAPCSHLPSGLSANPIDFPGGLQFLRVDDARSQFGGAIDVQAPFEHCRLVPYVIGVPADAAIDELTAFGQTNGQEPQVNLIAPPSAGAQESCPTGLVTGQGPRAGTAYREAASRLLMGLETSEDSIFGAAVWTDPC